ncbi:hypothetical protein DL96DRAFT_1723959 [Flagelloscypha sp. PMI_526]|nr:hypothetical protein DL96DRAFT_1723959 [Flagelloscypha sp. PMI_526]
MDYDIMSIQDYLTPITNSANEEACIFSKSLRAPRMGNHSTEQLAVLVERNLIQVNSDIQSSVDYDNEVQINLAESILRSDSVHRLLFTVKITANGAIWFCLDPKQYLTTLWRSRRGDIPHKDPASDPLHWFRKNGENEEKTTKTLVPEYLEAAFKNKQICCLYYDELQDEIERDVFTYLQQDPMIDPWIKMLISNTSRSEFIRELMKKYFYPNAPLVCVFEINMQLFHHSRFVAHAVAITATGSIGTAASVEHFLGVKQPLEQPFKQYIGDAYQLLECVVRNKSIERLSNKCFVGARVFSPIEIILAPVLLYKHRGKMTNCQFARAIRGMRDVFRSDTISTGFELFKSSIRLLGYIKSLDPASVPNPPLSAES